LVSIRRAVASDAAGLAALRAAWGAEHGDTSPGFVAVFEEWVRGSGGTHVGFVAEDSGEVVGMVWLARLERPPSPDEGRRLHGDVQSVYVVPARRGAGVGTALTAAVIDEARRLGMTRLTVQSSGRAVPLYQRAGFAFSDRLLRLDL
jgi:GNAT superfamily N-acetyltransferase